MPPASRSPTPSDMGHTPANGPDSTLTTREAANLLGLAVRSVQLMVDRGDLQAWKTSGGHRRITRASVDAWLTRRPAAARSAHKPTPTGWVNPVSARRRASDSKQPTVVLIEDSSHFQSVIKLMLQRSHPQVSLHVASDAIVGLALCGAVRPDILMVDLMLPGIDGATLISSLRSQKHFAGLQLMVVTGLDERQRDPYAFALDGIPVVEKKDMAWALPKVLAQLLAKAASAAPR